MMKKSLVLFTAIILIYPVLCTCDIWREYINLNHADQILSNGSEVWVRAELGGLVNWDMDTGTPIRYYGGHGLPQNIGINNFIYDDQNRLIFSTTGKQIYRFENGAFNLLTEAPITIENMAYSDGTILIGSPNDAGLYKFDGETWESIPEFSSYGGLLSIAADPNGGFWTIALQYSDWILIYYKDGIKKTFTKLEVTNDENMHMIYVNVDRTGIVWAMLGEGVAWYDGSSWKQYYYVKDMSQNYFKNAIRSSDGTVWVAGGFDGLFKYDGNQWTKLPQYQDEMVFWVAEAQDGIWVGTPSSLDHFDGETRIPYTIANSIPLSNMIRTIDISPKGELWCGDVYGDIAFLHNNTWNSFRGAKISLKESKRTGSMECILASKGSGIWCGFHTEILRYYNDEWISYFDYLYPKIGMVYKTILEGPDGSIWVKANNGLNYGIAHWKNDNWDTYNQFYIGQGSNLMTFDSDGYLWVATGDGIYIWDNVEWKLQFKNTDFLNSDYAHRDYVPYSLSGMNDGTVWGMSNKAIVVFKDREISRYFTADDGSLPLTFDGVGLGLSYARQAPDNTIWVKAGDCLLHYDGSIFKKYDSSDSGFYIGGYDMKIDNEGNIFLPTNSGLIEFTPTSVTLKMSLFADQIAYKAGDKLNLSLMVNNYGPDETGDLYFVMLAPDGKFYSGLDWSQGVHPAASNLTIPANFSLPVTKLLSLTLPSTTPPISQPGKYYFAIALADTGTTYLRSKAIITVNVQ
jgi:ligand-binding sensor domain-containing protein